MADGRKVQYLIELLPDTKQFEKIRDKMKAIDGGEFIKFEPGEVKKLKGILQGVVDDAGKRASSIGTKIQEGIASGIDKNKLQKMLDVDTSKLIETMEIVEKLTGLIDDHSKGSSWLKDGKGFLGKLSGSQQELKSLEQSIGQLELKFEGLDASLTSTIAKLDALATAIRSFQDTGKPIVVSPINVATGTKQVQQFEKEITKLQTLMNGLSSKKLKKNDNALGIFTEAHEEALRLEQVIEELENDADKPELKGTDKGRVLRTEIAERKLELAKLHLQMQKADEKYLQENKGKKSLLFSYGVEDVQDVVKEAKTYATRVVNELSKIETKAPKQGGSAIGIEVALPSEADIKNKINGIIDNLNKPNSLHKVKLEIDDVANIIEDANKRVYGDSPADDDAKTTELVQKTENRLDRVAQAIKRKQDAIFDRTDDWRKKMINAMSINAKDLEFQFGLESNMENTADALFNKLQEYFERPEYALDIKFNTEKIARDLKASLEAEGIELGVSGISNADINSLISALYSAKMPITSHQTSGGSSDFAQKEVADETDEAVDSSKEYVKVLDETTIHIDKVIESLREFAGEATKSKASKGSKAIASRLLSKGIDVSKITNDTSDAQILKMIQEGIVRIEKDKDGNEVARRYSLMAKDEMGKPQGGSLVGEIRAIMSENNMDAKKGAGKIAEILAQDIMELFNINEIEMELESQVEKRFKQLNLWQGIEKPGKALAALGNVRSTKNKTKLPEMQAINDAIEYFKDAKEDTTALEKLKNARQKFEDNGQTDAAKAEFEKAANVFYDETKDVFKRLKARWGDFKGTVQAEGRKPVLINPKGAYPTRILEIPKDAIITKVEPFEAFEVVDGVGFQGSTARRESSFRKAEQQQKQFNYGTSGQDFLVPKPHPKKDVRYEGIEYDTFKTQESGRLPTEVALDATIESLEKQVAEIPELISRIETSKRNVSELEVIKQQIENEISNLQIQDLPEFHTGVFEQYSKRDLSITQILSGVDTALKTNTELNAGDISALDNEQKSLVDRLKMITTNIHNDAEASQELADKIAEIVEAKKLSKQELEIARSNAAQQRNKALVDLYGDLLFNRSSVDSRLESYQSQKSAIDVKIGDNKRRANKLSADLGKFGTQSSDKSTKEAEALATQLIEVKDRLYAEAKTYADILNNSSVDDKAREIALGKLQETLRGLNQITSKFATIQAYIPQSTLYDPSQQNNVDKWNKKYTNREVRKLEKELNGLEEQLKTEEDETRVTELKKKIANVKRNLTRLKKSVPANVSSKKRTELTNIERQLTEEQSKLTVDQNRKRIADEASSNLQSTKKDAAFLTKYNELLEKEKLLLEEVNRLKREGVDQSVIDAKTDELKQATKALDDFLKKENTAERTAYAREVAVEYQAQLQTAYRKRSVFDNQIQGLNEDEENLTKYGLSGRVGSRARRHALGKATSEYMSSDDVKAQEEAIRKNEQLSWEQRDKQLKELRQKLREEFAKKFDDTNVQQDELDRIAAERAIAEAGREPLDKIIQDLQTQKKTAMRYGAVSDDDLKNDKYLRQNEAFNKNILDLTTKLVQKEKELEAIKSDDTLDEKTQEKKIKSTQKEIDAINQEIQHNQKLIDNRIKLMELHKQEKAESKQTPEEKALLATEKLVSMKQTLAETEEKIANKRAEYESSKGTENEMKTLEALDNQIKKRDELQKKIESTESNIARWQKTTSSGTKPETKVTITDDSKTLASEIKEAVNTADVDLTPVTEILQNILEVLGTFKTEGVKSGGTVTASEEKPKQAQKTEADLIRDNALKQSDVIKGLAAGRGSLYNQYTRDVEELNKAVEEANAASEKDKKKAIAKVKTKAQKVSALSYNILKNTSQWDYLVANSDSGAKNMYLKQGESLKDKMEIMAKKEHGILGKRGGKLTNPKYQYDFLGFDGDTLTYQLTDIEGKTRKVTMVWNEFTKQVAITSDKSVAKLDVLASKVETFGEKFKNAVQMGYLAGDDDALVEFQKKVEDISKATTFDGVEKARNEALQTADKVAKKIASNKKLYTGTTEMNAATRQYNNLEASGILDQTDLQMVEDYKAKYAEIAKIQDEWRAKDNGKGLLNPEAQKQLRQAALEAKNLGKELEKSVNNSQRLNQLVENSGTYNGQNIGEISQLQEGINVYDAMRAKLEELGATNIKIDRIRKTATGTIRHDNRTVSDLTVEYDKLTNSLGRYQKAERESLTGIPAFLNGFKKKMNSIMQYLTMTMSIHRVISELRRGVQYVKEIDLALTELKKVTDETEETYKEFLETAAKTADKVGSTIQKVVSSTADWARLGYSMEQAAKFAETTQILMNVSEFTDVSQATDALISSVQAFGYTAETSMEVVDLLNTIGNNYAISTADLAQSLTKSSASLVAAGGDLAEAAALTATANKIIQDADSVGTALKTTSLRLRGTDVKVLEEEGLDSEGAVTSKSKLQSKVKALSGVDILTATGEYKSTYEILSDIADVWESINDMDQAALLELISGKRNSSVVAAILQNPEELKAAYEDANDAEGSALKENEKYLDSIQGKIDQFNNAVQSLWQNLLGSDAIKWVVEWGTKIVKSLDTTQGKILAIIKAVALLAAYKKVNPMDWIKDIGTWMNTVKTNGGIIQWFKSLVGLAPVMQTMTAETMANTLATTLNDEAKTKAAISSLGFTSSTQALTVAQRKQAIETLIANKATNGLKDEQIAAIAAMWGLKTSTDATTGSIKVLDTTTKSFMASNWIGWILLAVSALVSLVVWVSQLPSKTEKLTEKLSDLQSEISDLESEIDALNSELETTQERMAELLSKDSLSFVEEEELKNLKLQNELLEKKIALQESILASKMQQETKTSANLIDDTWNGKSVDKKYYIADNGVIGEDKWFVPGTSSKDALDQALPKYAELKKKTNELEAVYVLAQKEMAENGELTRETFEKILDLDTDNLIDDVYGAPDWYYGDDEYMVKKFKGIIDSKNTTLGDMEDGIEMVFGDLLEQIPEDYQYGSNDIIDQAYDELMAYRLKYDNSKGLSNKSEIISSIFGPDASEELQQLKKDLEAIASSEDDVSKKTQDAQVLIQQAYESTDKGYKRLKSSIDIVGISVGDLAKAFIATTEAPDVSTPEGVIQVYQDGIGILKKYKDARDEVLGQDENGENITWNNLFSLNEDGKKVADNLKVAAILEGSDEAIREEFTKMIEAVENGETEVNDAISKFSLSGLIKIADMAESKWADINKSMFKGLEDKITGWIDSFSELSSALENVASSMDLISEANEQMSNSGQISVKTALELMNSTDNWNELLTIQDGQIRLNADAENILVQSKLNAIKAQNEEALSSINLQLAQMGAIDTAIVATEASDITTEAYAQYTEAIDSYSAAIAGFQAAIGALLNGENPLTAYQNARDVILSQQETQRTVDATRLQEQKAALEEQRKMLEVIEKQGFENIYDFDKNPGDKNDDYESADDAFQKLMDYWENRIAANQAKYEQLQNEIDLLEKKGQKADASFYEEQIELENERLWLLEQQKAAAKEHLATLEEGSEEWWEVANTLNDIEAEFDDVTASIVDLQDAIAEIDTYKFEEFNNRLDNLTSKLETIRNLIAPDGEEDWFDDEGNWTEAGVAVLGSQLQSLEMYKQGYQETMDELAKYEPDYEGNEAYYEALGIHSEQEWYEKTEQLISQQYDFANSISDTEQSIVDMYESSIDAIEEYTDKLIDGYNDYIDSIKEALDAERDLYDFKKNVQKQTKDIAALERRIASLSGSTNASDIAERRRLESELYGAREELNDTYYDHAKDAQSEALDKEAQAYEESMNNMIEGLRTSLEEATSNMDEFLMGVTSMVMYNADTVLAKYEETNLPLTTELTNPWIKAQEAVGTYSGDALALMNKWTEQGGFFAQFNASGTTNLQSPWSAGTTAANSFKSSVSTAMSGVVSNIATNVKTASGELSKLYQQIQDTEKRASNANVVVSGSGSGSGSGGGSSATSKKYYVTAFLDLGSRSLSVTKSDTNASAAMSAARIAILGEYEKVKGNSMSAESAWQRTYRDKVKYTTQYYAKGTTGVDKDQWAITDEPQFGDELVLVPGKDGNLSFVRKGTGIVPADMTQKLVELAQIPTSDLMNKSLTAIVPNITKNDFKNEFNFDSLVHVDTVDSNTLPKLEKMIDKKIDDFSRALNYSIKKFAR